MTRMTPKLTFAALMALGVLAATPAGAVAVPLPSATTEGASEVAFDAATLNGTVVPGGTETASDTKWCFEYGTAGGSEYNLGSVPLLPGEAGQGTSGVPVSFQLTRLQPGSTYRYRLVAVNALGMGLGSTACGTEGGQEALGAEALFTTPTTLPAPVAVTGAASGISQNTATITGTVDPNGSRTSYEFQVGLDTSYGAQVFGEAGADTEPTPVSLGLLALQPGTTYHYRLVALSPSGTSYGADAMFTTPVFPTAMLSAPAAPPLVATPAFAFPSQTTAATTGKPKATKAKGKRKSRRKKTAKKGRKASRAGRSRTDKGRSGR